MAKSEHDTFICSASAIEWYHSLVRSRSPPEDPDYWEEWKTLGIAKNENTVISTIEGAEKDGVHAISRNFVIFELHRITGFGVIFQISDVNVEA